MKSFDGLVDRWYDCDFVLPGTLLKHSGGRPSEDPPDDQSRAVRLHSCQTLTPDAATTTHYFFQQSHRGAQANPEVVQIRGGRLRRLSRRWLGGNLSRQRCLHGPAHSAVVELRRTCRT